MVSDKTIHTAFRTRTPLWTKSIRDIFVITIYQNYTLALTESLICSFPFRSTQEVFNPKPAEQKHLSHSLIELLNKVSPSFKKNFAQLLKKRWVAQILWLCSDPWHQTLEAEGNTVQPWLSGHVGTSTYLDLAIWPDIGVILKHSKLSRVHSCSNVFTHCPIFYIKWM